MCKDTQKNSQNCTFLKKMSLILNSIVIFKWQFLNFWLSLISMMTIFVFKIRICNLFGLNWNNLFAISVVSVSIRMSIVSTISVGVSVVSTISIMSVIPSFGISLGIAFGFTLLSGFLNLFFLFCGFDVDKRITIGIRIMMSIAQTMMIDSRGISSWMCYMVIGIRISICVGEVSFGFSFSLSITLLAAIVSISISIGTAIAVVSTPTMSIVSVSWISVVSTIPGLRFSLGFGFSYSCSFTFGLGKSQSNKKKGKEKFHDEVL